MSQSNPVDCIPSNGYAATEAHRTLWSFVDGKEPSTGRIHTVGMLCALQDVVLRAGVLSPDARVQCFCLADEYWNDGSAIRYIAKLVRANLARDRALVRGPRKPHAEHHR